MRSKFDFTISKYSPSDSTNDFSLPHFSLKKLFFKAIILNDPIRNKMASETAKIFRKTIKILPNMIYEFSAIIIESDRLWVPLNL